MKNNTFACLSWKHLIPIVALLWGFIVSHCSFIMSFFFSSDVYHIPLKVLWKFKKGVTTPPEYQEAKLLISLNWYGSSLAIAVRSWVAYMFPWRHTPSTEDCTVHPRLQMGCSPWGKARWALGAASLKRSALFW